MVVAAELRELDDDELETRLAEYRRELLNLRFQLATGQLDNVTRLGQVRRDVARALTILRRRELGLEEENAMVASPAPARRRRAARAEVADEDTDDVDEVADEDTDDVDDVLVEAPDAEELDVEDLDTDGDADETAAGSDEDDEAPDTTTAAATDAEDSAEGKSE